MPYFPDQRLKERVSIASAIRELAADYLLGALGAIEYRQRLRELIARYPEGHSTEHEPLREHHYA